MQPPESDDHASVLRFAHLSDFHFTTAPGNFSDLRPDLPQALQAIVDDLCHVESYLDFIAITGDLTEDGKLASYRGLKDLLSAISVPVLLIPGNHDSRDAFRDVFPPPADTYNVESGDYFLDIGEARIIGIDSVDIGKTTGKLAQAQLSWLETTLSTEDGSRHIVVMIHHPPFSTGRSEFDAVSNLIGTAELASIIRNQSRVTLLCGHVHRPYQAVWAGAACFIAGSPSCQLSADPPFGQAPLRLVDEPYAYFLHTICRNGNRTVGTRYVNL